MFNLIISVLFIGVESWLLLVQPSFLTIGNVHSLSIYTIFIFLFCQGLFIQQLKGQEENRGMTDFSLSVIVLIFQVIIFIFASKVDGWFEIYTWFLLVSFYDFGINNRMILRMFRMSTGVAQE